MRILHGWLQVALPALALILAPSAKAAPQHIGKAAPGTTTKIDFDKDAIKPTVARTAAIRRATANDLEEPLHPDQPLYSVALADLNNDGRADLLIQYTYASGFCGSAGCSGMVVMATPSGYARKGVGLPNFGGELDVLPSLHQGMHDLQFNGDSPVWTWDGKQYGIENAYLRVANTSPWETRKSAGRPMTAVATPIDSTIKNLLVFCKQATPLLAMVMKMRPPTGPVTLTFVFRGWTVNLPMQPDNTNATLWVGDLSGSDLPRWLAHRGNTPTTSELARLAGRAFLRIDGTMQGEISLANSTAATQAALGACYRY